MAARSPLPEVLVIGSSPLVAGRIVRRRQLHDAYGGSRQSGNSVLGTYEGILCFTGESGTSHAEQGLFSLEEAHAKFVHAHRRAH